MNSYEILVLEDDAERMKKIKTFIIGHTYIWCKTAPEAINVLNDSKIDWVCLDHDLADEHYLMGSMSDYRDVPEGLIGTGQDVADWIAYNTPDIKGVLIHSLNPAGGKNMERVLTRHDIYVKYVPGMWDSRYGTIEQLITL